MAKESTFLCTTWIAIYVDYWIHSLNRWHTKKIRRDWPRLTLLQSFYFGIYFGSASYLFIAFFCLKIAIICWGLKTSTWINYLQTTNKYKVYTKRIVCIRCAYPHTSFPFLFCFSFYYFNFKVIENEMIVYRK